MTRCTAISALLTAATLAAAPSALAGTVYIDCDNASGIEDGSSEHPFQLISSGMDAASFGDTVLVMPGTYSENIIVDTHDPDSMNRAAVIMKDGVKLVADGGPDSTLIRGVGTEAAVYFDSCGNGTWLSGFAIETSGYGWGLRTSILCWNSSPSLVGNALLPLYSSIYCERSSSSLIQGNSFSGGGIVLTTGSGGIIRENEIRGGIAIDSSGGEALPALVESNWIYSEGRPSDDYGVDVAWGEVGDVRIIDNTIQNKEVGMKLCYGEVSRNRFVSNDVNVKVRTYCDSRVDINAKMNWWGTTDPAEIEAKIIDCHDDGAIPGCVDYEPWCLDEDCTQSPVLPLSWGRVKSLYRPE